MKYQIIAEAHEGVFSVDEEVWATVEAEDAESAMKKYSETEPRVKYITNWSGWFFNQTRKIWAQEIK